MNAIRINERDNVAVALMPLQKGQKIEIGEAVILLAEDIPQGHKFLLTDLREHGQVIKYGFPIGTMTQDAAAGSWIHVHNLRTGLTEETVYSYRPSGGPGLPDAANDMFWGYRRENGRVGIRNEVWIVPTNGCVNSVAQAIAAGEPGVFAFSHPYGCSQMGDDQENTLLILTGLIKHPNAGAVLVLGLGCENCNMQVLRGALRDVDERRISFLECQEAADEIAEGKKQLRRLRKYAEAFQRVPIPASELVVGLKCGGSDGLSGITANPLAGWFSDRLIAQGGSALLTEIPEMFGAEELLLHRCKNEEVFAKMANCLEGFKEYYRRHGQVIYENPSPGNKTGGISTLEDKSLGCVQKGGSAQIADVLAYGEAVQKSGLSVLSAPGNDLVAATALAAAGAQLVIFTTGRGTPFGCPVPTIKVSSNDELAEKKPAWTDFNAGQLLRREISPENILKAFAETVFRVASGEETKAERNGYRDMAILKTGVTL